jgi:3-oxoadipate enol-lactonase
MPDPAGPAGCRPPASRAKAAADGHRRRVSGVTLTTSDGVRLVYVDAGPRDGVPIVSCHGLAASGAQFVADSVFFSGLGYRVIVPELRGHGASGKGTDYSIKRMALDLVELLKHAGVGPVHWVGNSLGGILALHLLGERPELFRTLATFGTSYALNLPAGPTVLIPLSYRVFGRELVAWVTARMTTQDKPARELIAAVIRSNDPEVVRAAAARVATYDLINNGVAATLPILMLRCGRDGAVNAALGPTLKAMTGRPNFTLVEVPEGGHCANLDATGDVRRELLAFWDRAGR